MPKIVVLRTRRDKLKRRRVLLRNARRKAEARPFVFFKRRLRARPA